MKKSLLLLIVFILSISWGGVETARAGEIRIIAASDLQYAMKDIIAAYEGENPGDRFTVVFGSSGKAFSQIANGAPYDIYFSADIIYPEKLKAAGLAIGAAQPYAIGRIGLWATKKSGIDVSKGPDILLDKRVKKIAMANPLHAPYGRAAAASIEHFRLSSRVKHKIVLGENIQQAAQFVQSGAAEVGLIAYSLALYPPIAREGNFYLLPANSHNELVQGFVLLKSAQKNQTALKFAGFVGSPAARAIFKKYGFVLPHE